MQSLTRFYPPALVERFARFQDLPVNAPIPDYLAQRWNMPDWPGMRWLITDKGDLEAWALAERHYTRQTPGARLFTRNGQNLVFVTKCGQAAWVSFRPTPGKATRPDKLDGIECALFRNESRFLSSTLIWEALALTVAIWGQPPDKDGVFTYVKPSAIRSTNPGACYKKAGWKTIKGPDGKPLLSTSGLPRLRAPAIPELDWRVWQFKDHRGGKLRAELTGWDGKSKCNT